MELVVTTQKLIDVVAEFYPLGAGDADDNFEGYWLAREYQKLQATRARAAAENAQWNELLERLRKLFPGNVENRSLHLHSGTWDAGYSATVSVPQPTTNVKIDLNLVVSFVAPCYMLYQQRWELPSGMTKWPTIDDESLTTEQLICNHTESIELDENIAKIAASITNEIESIFHGYGALSLEMARMSVADRWLTADQLGATLAHFLLSNQIPIGDASAIR
jgi:hypothetical protein